MYWPQAKALEYNLLIKYLEIQNKNNNPIYIGGFDPRIMHKDNSFSYIHSILSVNLKKTQHEIDLSSYLNILKNVLDLEYKDTLTTVNEKKIFLKKTERIIGIFESIGVNKRDIQLLNSLIYFAKNAWNIDDLHDKSPDRYTFRDIGIFENIKWYL